MCSPIQPWHISILLISGTCEGVAMRPKVSGEGGVIEKNAQSKGCSCQREVWEGRVAERQGGGGVVGRCGV